MSSRQQLVNSIKIKKLWEEPYLGAAAAGLVNGEGHFEQQSDTSD